MRLNVLIILLFWGVFVHAQASFNLKLRAHYNDTTLPKLGDQIWNDVMGWKDTVKNKEYMISGTTDSIYFFDVTQPDTIILCARFSGTNTRCVNRDYYPYHHYLYAVSDQCLNSGNLQIFDMQYLPDSVVKVYESDTLGALTHSIFIEAKSKRLYMAINKVYDSTLGTTRAWPLDIISLENPTAPTRIGRILFPAPYNAARVHEAYVRNDTAYCSSENAGLFIVDVTRADSPVLISAIVPPYPQNAYNHSSWLDSSGRYLLFCDETPEGVGMKVYDLKDIREPRIVNQPFKEEGSPHNAYWMGDYVYASMYYGGVQIYNLQDPAHPFIVAYYDTYPKPYDGGYKGCWGVWPFLPSGKILASDMTYGLFVLEPTFNVGLQESNRVNEQLLVFPNPTMGKVILRIPTLVPEEAQLEVWSISGKLVAKRLISLAQGVNQIEENADLSPGLYVFKVVTKDKIYTARVVRLESN